MKKPDQNNIKRHTGRDDLAGEHKYGDLGQIVLVLLFIVALVIDLIWLNLLRQIRSEISLYIRIPLSLPFLIFSFYLIKMSHREIFENRREKLTVVQTGIYALVRHPMYLSTIVLCLAILILSLSVLSFIIWIILIIFYYYIASYEEQILISKLGDQYIEYHSKVPMLIPGLKRHK